MVQKNISYVTFDAGHSADFQDLILPNIWEELITFDDFSEHGILALAAMDGETPVGALIGRLTEEFALQIVSLWVTSENRGMGIGKGLIDAALGEALDFYTNFYHIPEEESVNIEISMEYILGGQDADAMEAFLRACGFRGFEEKGMLYVGDVKSDVLPVSVDAHSLSSVSAELTDDFNALGESLDIPMEPELSCYAGSAEDPDCVVLCSFGMDNDFMITSQVFGKNCDEKKYAGVLGKALQNIGRAYPGSVVTADLEKNVYPAVWEMLARKNGTLAKHITASRYVSFH